MLSVVGKELIRLKKDTRKSQRNAFAEGTFDNYLCQWVNYLEFCIYFRLVAFPASPLVLAWYAQFLTRNLKAHGSPIRDQETSPIQGEKRKRFQ